MSAVTDEVDPSGIWDAVVGQPAAVAHLRRAAAAPVHAYLFVGPPGSTKDEAARAFAAAVLGADGGEPVDPSSRDARLALAGAHPDVREVQRSGPAISFDEARDIVRLAALAPIEGSRKLMILHEFHLLRPEGAALLLKTIEEPPASTTFIVLADFVPPELVTISSRCVRVEFCPLPDDVLQAQLLTAGVDADTAARAVASAGGDLTRARLLAVDPALAERRSAFARLPRSLDGSGTTVMRAVEDLLARIDGASAPLAGVHAREVADLDARIEQLGERGSGRKILEERHKRELRRHRTDELRSGLAVLAGAYRDALISGDAQRPEDAVAAVHRIHESIEALERNPNEQLLLQSLIWSLPPLPSAQSGAAQLAGSPAT